jgi:hypothetical protein
MTNPTDARIAEYHRHERTRRENAPAPPSLPDPNVYAERVADHGEDSGRDFRKELRQKLVNTNTAVGRVHANPVLTESEKLLSVAADVEAIAKVIRADFDTQQYLIGRKQAELDEAIDRALRPTRSDWEAKGAELRSVLRTMDEDARFAFIDSVKGTRDELLVQFAIGAVPPAMSGVSLGVHKQIRDGLLERHDPTLLERPKDLAARAALLKVAAEGFERSIAELVDFDKAAALRQLVGRPS